VFTITSIPVIVAFSGSLDGGYLELEVVHDRIYDVTCLVNVGVMGDIALRMLDGPDVVVGYIVVVTFGFGWVDILGAYRMKISVLDNLVVFFCKGFYINIIS